MKVIIIRNETQSTNINIPRKIKMCVLDGRLASRLPPRVHLGRKLAGPLCTAI
jgi:hypothetical protein